MQLLPKAVLLSLIVHGFLLFQTYKQLDFAYVAQVKVVRAILVTRDTQSLTLETEKQKSKPKQISLDHRRSVPKRNVVTEGDSSEFVNDPLVSDFRFALARQAKLQKVYPLRALENGLEGVVQLDVRVIFGKITVLIHQSSGVEVLDQEARELVINSIQKIQMPVFLRGSATRFLLPVEFKLDRE